MASKKKTTKKAKSSRKPAPRGRPAKTSAPHKKSVKKKATSKTGRPKSKPGSAKTIKVKKVSGPSKKPTAKKPTAKKSTAKKATAKKATAKKATAKKATAKKATAKKAVQKEQTAAQRKREALRLKKEKEREKALLKKEKERKHKEQEQEKALLKKEKERKRKEQEREKALLLKEKERQRKEKEREKALLLKEKERERKERERQKERERKERERELERIRKEAEKERIRQEKQLEAYKKEREAQREKVRAEREAARQALEGRVAEQARRAQRIAGTARGSSSRVYRPDAIPSQAGTRKEGLGVRRNLGPSAPRSVIRPSTPAPPPREAPPATLEERWELIQKRLEKRPERFRRDYAESFDMSWIHHDSALEGVVYTYQELKTAIDPNVVIVPDSSLQPVCEEIRRHKEALEWAREFGKNDTPLSAEILKRLLLLLHPEEGDLKSVKYRKEIPQHRLYFHDYAPPDKIAVRIRQAFDWLHGPEPPKLKDPIRVAARLHYDLLRTFPFPQDSGKVARLCMNILLMRAGLPPVIVHSTERQRYYDALRGSLPTIVQMVSDSMRNAMASIEKVLAEEEAAA